MSAKHAGARMTRTIHYLTVAGLLASFQLSAAGAAPVSVPGVSMAPTLEATPVNGLLCGRSWHWSYAYMKCERHRHRCPAGKHWISPLRTCVGF